MDLHEVYEKLGGSYDNILHRLRSEEMVALFFQDFLEDEEYEKLALAIQNHEKEAAFHAVHTLKGIALNMEFGLLAKAAIALTDDLRRGDLTQAEQLFSDVSAAYHTTISLIHTYLENNR